MSRARGVATGGIAVLVLTASVVGLTACGGSSEDELSQADERTISKVSNLSRSYLRQYSVFVDALEQAETREAQEALDEMSEMSDTRLELVSDLENEVIREFFAGAQRFSNQAILLYQRVLDALEDGDLAEIDRLAKDEIRLSREGARYIRTESRRLLKLDRASTEQVIRKVRRIQAKFVKP